MKKENQEATKKNKKISKPIAATVLSVVSVVFCVLTAVGIIVLNRYFDPESAESAAFRSFLQENIVAGAVIFIGVCFLQVVVAFIPGEVVEVLAGWLFGPFWGTVIALSGIMLGSVAVMLLVRKLGRRYVEAFYPKEKLDALPILNDPKKRNPLVFLLFFIPGTPKDFLTYLVGLTDMSIPMYILLTTVARIPSILTSTLLGGNLSEGKWMTALWVFVITAVISGAGYIVYMLIQKRLNKDEKNKK